MSKVTSGDRDRNEMTPDNDRWESASTWVWNLLGLWMMVKLNSSGPGDQRCKRAEPIFMVHSHCKLHWSVKIEEEILSKKLWKCLTAQTTSRHSCFTILYVFLFLLGEGALEVAYDTFMVVLNWSQDCTQTFIVNVHVKMERYGWWWWGYLWISNYQKHADRGYQDKSLSFLIKT